MHAPDVSYAPGGPSVYPQMHAPDVSYAPGGGMGMPPLPGVLPENEDLANLLLAWYYAGFYTGKYTAGANGQRGGPY